jgi:ribosomal protein S18 acetylase RimI-like enzyme
MRGRGVGRQMLKLLVERSVQAGMQDVFLEVRPSNLHAIALYQSVGFIEVGRRRGYYQAVDGREDALVLKLSIPVKS